MRLKPGVSMIGVRPELVLGLHMADQVFQKLGFRDGCIVTSLVDGAHGPNSLHPLGNAADLRLASRMTCESAGIPWSERVAGIDLGIRTALRTALGPQFTVLLESDAENPWAWHFHIEFDPDA